MDDQCGRGSYQSIQKCGEVSQESNVQSEWIIAFDVDLMAIVYTKRLSSARPGHRCEAACRRINTTLICTPNKWHITKSSQWLNSTIDVFVSVLVVGSWQRMSSIYLVVAMNFIDNKLVYNYVHLIASTESMLIVASMSADSRRSFASVVVLRQATIGVALVVEVF